MKERRVEFAEAARDDLRDILTWVADASGVAVAERYIDRIVAFCARLSVGSLHGSLDPTYGEDVRRVGFERRVSVLFRVTDETVVIERLLNRGREDRGD